MSSPHLEEWAALHALGLLEEAGTKALLDAVENDPSVLQLMREFEEAAALMAYEAPPLMPPPELKRELLRRLPSRRSAAKVIHFAQWLPYALAACLMGLAIFQAEKILDLKAQVRSAHADLVELRNRNDLAELRLVTLEAKDTAYASAKVMVAWDPTLQHGMISLQNLPPPPAGHDYQLWLLDPSAPAPMSAGLLKSTMTTASFAVHPVSTSGPGFAISLEPSGGDATPTGAILFAVAPAQ